MPHSPTKSNSYGHIFLISFLAGVLTIASARAADYTERVCQSYYETDPHSPRSATTLGG